MNILKKILIISFLSLLIPSVNVYAECGGTSPTLVAASTAREDVCDCIDNAIYGDTIIIPEGSSTWTSGITITKDIKIKGAGKEATILTLGFSNDYSEEAMFKFVPDATARANLDSLDDTHIFEVTGIAFIGSRYSYKYAIWLINKNIPVIKRVAIHDNKFTTIKYAIGGPLGYIHGVFYENALYDSASYYEQGVGAASWTNDLQTMGSSDGWYIEDNTFTFSGSYESCIGGANNDGGGVVVRYNTSTGSISGSHVYIDIHSNQKAGIWGSQKTEIYGNNFAHTGGVSRAIYIRGGHMNVFNNVFAAGGLDVVEEYADAISAEVSKLDGTCPEYEDVRQTCLDSCICQKLHSSYFFNNRRVGGTVVNAIVKTGNFKSGNVDDYYRIDTYILNSPREVEENIEFFNQNTSFDGSVGMGCGTVTEMQAITPTTLGVGFWVTPQSCSEVSPSTIGANPTTPLSGTLYRSVSDGASGYKWEEYYTPYTYPHPLRNETNTTKNPGKTLNTIIK